VSWWLRRIVDFLNWVAARVSGRKYDLLARQVGHDPGGLPSPEGPDARQEAARPPGGGAGPSFIAIQVDGLAHDYLLQAMALGHLPNLQRLLAQGYRLQRWRCGLPSSTPSVQAGIMYGNNWDIPAFRWFEKPDGFAPMCRVPAHAARIKPRIANGRRGILTGGCSYMNMWDGDARLALFTLSAMGQQRFFEHLRGLGWMLLFVLIPWRLLRIVALTAWELLRDGGPMLARWARSGFRSHLEFGKSVLQTLSNVVLSEIQTFGVLLDIYRGMPAIYANFYGYDEVAHGDGPLGREALRALRRIDHRIREIDRVRRMYRPDTDLYVLSDHGLTPAVPFRTVAGQSLGQLVARCVSASVISDEPEAAPTRAVGAGIRPDGQLWLLDELDGIEPHLSARGKRLVRALRRRIRERTPPSDDLGWDLARGSDVVVRSSGSLAHIYFNVTPERMDVSEVAILYPDLIDALNDHPAIGLVLGVRDGRPVVITGRGTALLGGERLPSGLPDPEQAMEDLARLLSFPHSGDLVLLGAWDAPGKVVTFEDQAATHGGIGGPQDYPFFITPPGADFDLAAVTNAEQVYPFFARRYLNVEASNVKREA
jgi:hypothetical protein